MVLFGTTFKRQFGNQQGRNPISWKGPFNWNHYCATSIFYWEIVQKVEKGVKYFPITFTLPVSLLWYWNCSKVGSIHQDFTAVPQCSICLQSVRNSLEPSGWQRGLQIGLNSMKWIALMGAGSCGGWLQQMNLPELLWWWDLSFLDFIKWCLEVHKNHNRWRWRLI